MDEIGACSFFELDFQHIWNKNIHQFKSDKYNIKFLEAFSLYGMWMPMGRRSMGEAQSLGTLLP